MKTQLTGALVLSLVSLASMAAPATMTPPHATADLEKQIAAMKVEVEKRKAETEKLRLELEKKTQELEKAKLELEKKKK